MKDFPVPAAAWLFTVHRSLKMVFRCPLSRSIAAGLMAFSSALPLLANDAVGDPPDGNWQIGEPVVTYWAGAMPMTDAAAKQLADGGWNTAWVSWRGLEEGGSIVDH